jgi:hypothetical protein
MDLYHAQDNTECSHISFSMQRMSKDLNSTMDVYRHFVEGTPNAPRSSTFRGWVALGAKYASLAGAGG